VYITDRGGNDRKSEKSQLSIELSQLLNE